MVTRKGPLATFVKPSGGWVGEDVLQVTLGLLSLEVRRIPKSKGMPIGAGACTNKERTLDSKSIRSWIPIVTLIGTLTSLYVAPDRAGQLRFLEK